MKAPGFRTWLWTFAAVCMAFGGAVAVGETLAAVCMLVVMLTTGYRVLALHYEASQRKRLPIGGPYSWHRAYVLGGWSSWTTCLEGHHAKNLVYQHCVSVEQPVEP